MLAAAHVNGFFKMGKAVKHMHPYSSSIVADQVQQHRDVMYAENNTPAGEVPKQPDAIANKYWAPLESLASCRLQLAFSADTEDSSLSVIGKTMGLEVGGVSRCFIEL